jgi:hypothetical protein
MRIRVRGSDDNGMRKKLDLKHWKDRRVRGVQGSGRAMMERVDGIVAPFGHSYPLFSRPVIFPVPAKKFPVLQNTFPVRLRRELYKTGRSAVVSISE